MKRCPFCYEEVQDQAIKCKHCLEWLEKPKGKTGNDHDGYDPVQKWLFNELQKPKSKSLFDKLMGRIERLIIVEALRITDNNRTRAADFLGLSRPTIHSKIEKHKL